MTEIKILSRPLHELDRLNFEINAASCNGWSPMAPATVSDGVVIITLARGAGRDTEWGVCGDCRRWVEYPLNPQAGNCTAREEETVRSTTCRHWKPRG